MKNNLKKKFKTNLKKYFKIIRETHNKKKHETKNEHLFIFLIAGVVVVAAAAVVVIIVQLFITEIWMLHANQTIFCKMTFNNTSALFQRCVFSTHKKQEKNDLIVKYKWKIKSN